MKLSIIIPIYNVEKYLGKCVNSLISQNLVDTEILLIDDGSTDTSGKIADDLAKTHKIVKAFHKENGGLSDTRNYGIDKAKGKYLAFIDSDDYVDDNFNKIYDYLSDDYDIILTGMVVEYLKNKKVVKYKKEKFIDKKNKIINDCLQVCTKMNSACVKIVKKDLIVKNNLYFQSGYIEDFNWFGRTICYVDSAVITNLIYYHYIAERDGSIMNTFKKSKFYDVIKHSQSIINESKKLSLDRKDMKRIKQYIGFNILSNFRNIKHVPLSNQDEIINLLNKNYELIKYQKPFVMKLFLFVANIIGFKNAYKFI